MKRISFIFVGLVIAASFAGCGKSFDVKAYCAKATAISSLQNTLVQGDGSTLAADIKAATAKIKAAGDVAPSELKSTYNEVVAALNTLQPKVEALNLAPSSSRLTALATVFGTDGAKLQTDQSKIITYNDAHCSK